MPWFAVFASSILGLIYGYTGWRLIASSRIDGPLRWILWAILILAVCAPPAAMFTRRFTTWWADALAWFGFISFGFMLFAFIFAIVRDAAFLFAILGTKLSTLFHGMSGASEPVVTPNPERRRFLIQASNIGIVALAGGVSGIGFWAARKTPSVKPVEITVPHLDTRFENFRIVQISDLHVGPTIGRSYVETVVRTVNELQPDLIAVTGDLVDGSVDQLRKDVEPLRTLFAPFGTYFVTGNHEYYSGASQWVTYLRDEFEWNVLLNEHRVIERNGGSLNIAGITDFSQRNVGNSHRSDPAAAIRGARNNIPTILLAHQPMSVFAAAEAGVDVQLSGHTHGGQFFPWNLVVHLVQPYVSGLHQHENTQIYVNRGTGYWGPPIRFGVPSEITEITLRTA